MKTKTQLTITKPQYGDGRKLIVISIKDNPSLVHAVELSISLESFAEALTGLSEVECETRWEGLDVVGKKKVREYRQIEAPEGLDRKEYSLWLKTAGAEDGWMVDTYLGSQKSVIYRDGKTFLNYSVVKFVGAS